MAEINFKTPQQVRDEYLTNLKNLKPSVNTAQTDSDWFIRGSVLGGVVSGVYADQKSVSNDAFPQLARREAIDRHLFTYFNRTFLPAQVAAGDVLMTGATGSIVSPGVQLVFTPNGNAYQTANTDPLTIESATGLIVPVQSISTGQAVNLLSGALLSISSPPAGVDSSATALFPGIADGRNEETVDEAAQRILDRIRFPQSGGTESDYRQWARDASPSVTSSSVFRYIFGLGTVGIFITAGTTDIDAAIDADQAIVRIPSDDLVDTVQAYINARKPLTDCATVLKPVEISQNVTVRVNLATGFTQDSVVIGVLTVDELIKREMTRCLYKIPTGGRLLGASGYVLASEIEEALDASLGTSPYAVGSVAQLLADRQVDDLASTGVNRLIRRDEIVKPGVLEVVYL